MLEKIQETIKYIQNHTNIIPKMGIVLGTGLANFTREIEITDTIPYDEIPNFPVSTVKGHHGQLIFGHIHSIPVVALKGRFHYYEGYSMQLSNASGGTNADFRVGDIMIIEDHINLTGQNPLIGENDDKLGPRFPDMSEVYDHSLIKMAEGISDGLGLDCKKGVYAAVTGPNYETHAEYNYIRIIGADAVGMSTVPEAIVARHMDLPCFAVSVISDLGVGDKIEYITHEGVIDAASLAEPQMTKLILEMIRRLDG